MSRIGKQPVSVPSGVQVSVKGTSIITEGPRGRLEQSKLPGIKIQSDGQQVVISRENDQPQTRAHHGLMRALLSNMVTGVSSGFEKKLEINGVGYRVALSGDELRFNLGFSHPVVYKIPSDIKVNVEQNIISLSGIDKQRVGQVAAEIRALKKPEPYKGKGIKYVGEKILRKSGKSGKEQA